ncbi:MAG TPA: ribosome silencing factor [Planctomycetaceae bacterium]|nr:ribosome silencing factor [Planctomycetaceae bacterium]
MVSHDPARHDQLQRGLRHARLCARVCEDYKGKDTVVLDLSPVTPIVDYFVITTGTSRRQMHAIAEETDRILQGEGSARRGLEGYARSDWILQDYGDVVLHVFTAEARRTYDLERLWADAPRVDWRADLEALPAEAPPSEQNRDAGQE